MAKPAMVTRTIEYTEVTILGLDLELGEPMQKVITMPGTYKDDAKLLKAAQAALDTDTYKAVSVVRSEVNEQVYGMTEADFIAMGTVLDPKSRKPLVEYETTDDGVEYIPTEG